jgi:hypothetical protein
VRKNHNKIKEICESSKWPEICFRRHPIVEESLFTSPEAREVVERAFLKAGAMLVCAAKNPAESMRPLGFEKLISLGFGSMFITYRNISNNCPLALWYGDPSKSGPLSLWYPLFPRKTQIVDIYGDWGPFL